MKVGKLQVIEDLSSSEDGQSRAHGLPTPPATSSYKLEGIFSKRKEHEGWETPIESGGGFYLHQKLR